MRGCVRGVCIMLVRGGICGYQWGGGVGWGGVPACMFNKMVYTLISPLLPGVQHFLYAEVNDLMVQSHSPVRPPSPRATGGPSDWCPAERKSKERKGKGGEMKGRNQNEP